MKLEHDGKTPVIAASARIAPSAVICGDVEVGENCSIGFGCVLTAETGPIRIGDNCIIMDSAVLRGVRRSPLTLGPNVLVGPRAYLCGCTVERDAFLATGCTVLNGAHVGERAEVRINAIVHIRTRLDADAEVPLGWVAVGDPAEILPPDQHEKIWEVQKPLDFPGFVFGEGRPGPGETFMGRMMPRYGTALSRHRDDQVVEE